MNAAGQLKERAVDGGLRTAQDVFCGRRKVQVAFFGLRKFVTVAFVQKNVRVGVFDLMRETTEILECWI